MPLKKSGRSGHAGSGNTARQPATLPDRNGRPASARIISVASLMLGHDVAVSRLSQNRFARGRRDPFGDSKAERLRMSKCLPLSPKADLPALMSTRAN